MTPREAARRVIALEATALSAMADMIGPEFDAVVAPEAFFAETHT